MTATAPAPAQEPTRRLRAAQESDLSYVYSLQQRFSRSVGFCPRGAFLARIETARIILVTENDAPAGYVSFTHRRDRKTHISQLAIEESLWRTACGTDLLNRLLVTARLKGSIWLTLKCAELLPANEFWTASRFLITRTRTEQRRLLNCYARSLIGPQHFPAIAPAAQLDKMQGLR